MVRNRAAGRGFSVEQKRNAVCAVILGPLRADKEPLERKPEMPMTADLLGTEIWKFFGGPMAAATRVVSLNVGSQTLGLAEFRMQPQGRLLLHDYSLREILAEPAGEPMPQENM